MPNAFVSTSTVSNVVQAAYDRLVEFALRAQPTFRSVADKRPAQQAMPGSSVVLSLYSDLAQVTSTLTETTDPDSVAISNPSQVTITLNEYGNATLTTRKVDLLALTDVDPAVADIVAFNLLDSVDELAQTTLRAGTNILREAGGARSTTAAITSVLATDFFQSRDVRFTVAKLRAGKAPGRKGMLYQGIIHPEVSHDLRAESGADKWRDPHNYSAPDAIWAGEIGQYEGVAWVENPRCYNAVDGGSGGNTVRVFRTYVLGRQALAEAVSEEPHVVFGPVTDKLNRYRPVGWYGVLGWARYREACQYRIETTSSINTS